MEKKLFGLVLCSLLVLGVSQKSLAIDDSGFGGTLGASYEVGQLGNSGMGLQDRTMTAVSIEALPGYRLNSKWLVGLDFNYRLQQQQTKLGDAGNTNLAGKGWLLGLGAQYRINEKWAIQAALDLLGNYTLDKQTLSSQDNSLTKPLGLRTKAQYFIQDHWSVDGSLGYQSWQNFRIGSTDHSESSKQWMIGAGVTYHFAGIQHESPAPVSAPPPAPATAEPVQETQAEELSKIVATEKTENGIKMKLEGGGFLPYKSEVSEDLKQKIKAMAKVLVKKPSQRIVIEGYTDSSGKAVQNKKISQDRADAVKAVLIENGVSAERIQALGKGSEDPISSNKTKEGRAQNRRIEIKLEEGV